LLYPDPKDREQALEGLNNLVKPGDTYKTETIIQTKNGTKKNILVSTTLVLYKDCRMFLSTYHDITKRKRAEEDLQENKERYRSLIETINDWVWEVDQNGVYIYVSPKVKDLLGYEPEEVIGKTPFEFMPPKEAKHIATKFKAIIESQKSFERLKNTNLHRDGQRVVLETSGVPILDDSGNLLGYRGIDRDITERNKAEEELQKSMKRYRELYERSRDGYITMNMDGEIIEYNSSFKKMIGYTDEELHKKTCKGITPQEWHLAEAAIIEEQVLKRGYSNIYEKELIRKDGKIIPVEIRRNLLKENGKPIGTWVFVRDITNRKQTENELMKKIKDLEKYKNITIGRELRIIELKKKVKQLEEKMKRGEIK
jgi:PAS domain S-box-containing protein